MTNSEINITNNYELNDDLTNISYHNMEENQLGPEIGSIKNNETEDNINDIDVNNDNINAENVDNAYHHVQIIDEDVENFKRRLDIMVKNFRTDTLKEFMAIKRNLLIE